MSINSLKFKNFTNFLCAMRDFKRNPIPCWQKSLAQGFSSASDLLEFLQLPQDLAAPLAEQPFKTRVPRGFAERMQQGNPNDPLLLQVLAIQDELVTNDDYALDPLHESANNPIPGLIHKYASRVLLTLTGACAINCRYCFRRHFPYENNNPGRSGWRDAYEYIQNDNRINEVILSGGDPLLAKDTVISELLEQLALINHVQTIRIHTRIPIVLPERVNNNFLNCLEKSRFNKVMVLHCNHPQELDQTVADTCSALRQANCHLLNQSVYLKGINDNPQVLSKLSERLFSIGILPYYLHVLDKVQGAAHFDTPIEEVLTVYKEIQCLLPGYLVPRLAREEPGKLHKTIITN